MRATPPSRRMSVGTRSRAITATAPASSAILACSAVTTSMITPPRSISASPRLTRSVPIAGSCPLPAMAPVYEAERPTLGLSDDGAGPRPPASQWALRAVPTGASSIQVWPGVSAIGAPLASVYWVTAVADGLRPVGLDHRSRPTGSTRLALADQLGHRDGTGRLPSTSGSRRSGSRRTAKMTLAARDLAPVGRDVGECRSGPASRSGRSASQSHVTVGPPTPGELHVGVDGRRRPPPDGGAGGRNDDRAGGGRRRPGRSAYSVVTVGEEVVGCRLAAGAVIRRRLGVGADVDDRRGPDGGEEQRRCRPRRRTAAG